jgi:hypothetical protein
VLPQVAQAAYCWRSVIAAMVLLKEAYVGDALGHVLLDLLAHPGAGFCHDGPW